MALQHTASCYYKVPINHIHNSPLRSFLHLRVASSEAQPFPFWQLNLFLPRRNQIDNYG